MKQLAFISFCLLIGQVHAADTSRYAQLSLAMSAPDAGSQASFSTRLGWDVLAGYQWQPAWAVELRLAGFSGSEDTGADNVGTYDLSLDTRDLGVGVRWHSAPFGNGLQGVVRGGLLHYRLDLELEEAFYDLRPAGKVSQTETGTGYYLGAGLEAQVDQRITWDALLYYANRLDVFKRSPRGFDLKEWRLSAGVRYSF